MIHQLGDFILRRNSVSHDLLLMANGTSRYKTILSRAFSSMYFSRTFEDRNGQFEWGTYIKGASTETEESIGSFCDFLRQVLYIDDDLDESFALSYHTQLSETGSYTRTHIGELVYTAKPYSTSSHPGDKKIASELAQLMSEFILNHPSFRHSDFIVCVPSSNPSKGWDLPTFLLEKIIRTTKLKSANEHVSKVRNTKPMKDCQTSLEKLNNIEGAFQVDSNLFTNKNVVIIDDIYESGFSINELGRTLRTAGIANVLGLTATKTARGFI